MSLIQKSKTKNPKLLLQAPTVDNDSDGSEKSVNTHPKVRHQRSLSDNTGTRDNRIYTNPVDDCTQGTYLKGHHELKLLISSSNATANLLNLEDSLLYKRGKPSIEVLHPSSASKPTPPKVNFHTSPTKGMRTPRKTARLPKNSGESMEVEEDLETIAEELVEHAANRSTMCASALHLAQLRTTFPFRLSLFLIDNYDCNINGVDKDGDTALHWAVIHNHIESVKGLIENGADQTIRNSQGDAPVHLAIKSCNINLVLYFFAVCHLKPLLANKDRNYLHLACDADNLQIVQIILEKSPRGRISVSSDDILGVSVPLVSMEDEDKLTPVHIAARKSSDRILSKLLEACSQYGQLEPILLAFSSENYTPLHYAVGGGMLNNVKLLLKVGASPLTANVGESISSLHLASTILNDSSSFNKPANDILSELLRHCMALNMDSVNDRDADERTPLHYAVKCDNTDAVEVLYQYEANLDSPDKDGTTPLMLAAARGATKCLKLLISKEADLRLQNKKGQTALMVAITERHFRTARELLKHQEAPYLVEIPDQKGQTPLHAMCLVNGDISTLDMLLANQADVHARDKNREIPLHYACKFGSYSMAFHILQESLWGSMLNESDAQGYTPLHMAAQRGYLDIVKLLLQKGALITKCNKLNSPFALACMKGHIRCAEHIHKTHKACLNWYNNDGQTALHLAAANSYKDTVTWLLDNKCLFFFDYCDLSFFDIAIRNADHGLITAVLDHSRWEEAMCLKSEAAPPPFVAMVQYLPDAAKTILDRAVQESTSLDSNDVNYYHKINFKYLANDKIAMKNKEKTEPERKRTGALNTLKRDSIMRASNTFYENPGIQLKPLMGGSFSKPNVEENEPGPKSIKTRILDKIKRMYSFETLIQRKVDFEKTSLYAINAMIEHYRLSLLTHPVTKHYLDYKWSRYGLFYYSINLLPFLIFMILMMTELWFVFKTTEALYDNDPMLGKYAASTDLHCDDFYQYKPATEQNETLYAERVKTSFFSKTQIHKSNLSSETVETFNCSCLPQPPEQYYTLIEYELLILVPLFLVTIGLLISSFVNFLKRPILYWFNVKNMFVLLALILALTIRENPGFNYDRAAMSLFFGFGALFLQLQRYSWSGIYVTMFIEVTKSMLKTFLVFIPILFAYIFAFFFFIYPNRGFESFDIAVVRILIMLTGEFDFYESFLQEGSCYRSKELVYIILLIFTFAITIVVANLLIGIAVGDIDNILRQAVVSKAIEQVTWLAEFESSQFRYFIKSLFVEDYVIYPNRTRYKILKLFQPLDVFGVLPQNPKERNIQQKDISDPNLLFLISIKDENLNLKYQLQDATDKISSLQTDMAQILGFMQKMDQQQMGYSDLAKFRAPKLEAIGLQVSTVDP